MQKLCCVRTRQHLCQFGLFRHNFTTVSPPILNHFWWELYHGDIRRVVETRARPTMSAPNRAAIAAQLGIPETTTVGDGETARIMVDPLVQMMFAEEVKEHVKRTRKLEENIKFLWTYHYQFTWPSANSISIARDSPPPSPHITNNLTTLLIC